MIIVTGATGFVGRYLIDYLVNLGETVVAVGHTKKHDKFFEDRNVTLVSMDVSNPDSFSILPKKSVKAFVHLAAVIPATVKDICSDIFLQTNTLGTLNALNFCKHNSIEKFIFTTI